MIEVREEKNIHLSNFARFETELSGTGSTELHRLRRDAIRRFAELGFPGPRDEDWKFTSVAPIAKLPFRPVLACEPSNITIEQIERVAVPMLGGLRLVFVNGQFAPDLSLKESLPDGVVVESLAKILTEHPDWAEPHLAQYADYESHAFTALNTAFIQDGAFVLIPKGKVVEQPIYLVFVACSAGEGCVSHPRNLILAGANSQATVVEIYAGLEEEVYFTNAVTEVIVDENGVIDHYKLQRESEEAFHVATTQILQGKSSNFSSHYISLGGGLVRNEVRALLGAEGCECRLNGLYLAGRQQHIDNHTVIDHAKPRCASHELYKGILDDKAHGVFNGKIFVRQDAQKTDAKQTNQTLLLSEDAVINTKPQLEIFADDVKCTHGATVGQLQEDALFYLRSRGLGPQAARSLLTYAFANDIIGRVKVASIRTQLEDLLLAAQHLPPSLEVTEAL